MKIPARLIEFLNQNKVRYQILHHPVAFTAQELAAIEGVKGKHYAKVVIVNRDGALWLTVLPAERRVDLDKLGPRTTLAAEAEFQTQFPDCAVGTMPPLGSLYNVPTVVDQSLTDDADIVFAAGTHTDAIKMSYADYLKLAQPQVANFAVKTR